METRGLRTQSYGGEDLAKSHVIVCWFKLSTDPKKHWLSIQVLCFVWSFSSHFLSSTSFPLYSIFFWNQIFLRNCFIISFQLHWNFLLLLSNSKILLLFFSFFSFPANLSNSCLTKATFIFSKHCSFQSLDPQLNLCIFFTKESSVTNIQNGNINTFSLVEVLEFRSIISLLSKVNI